MVRVMTLGLVAAALGSSLSSCGLRAAAATDASNWNRPAEPFRVVGPVHFVGTSELGAFLVTTPAGHVLIDGGLPESAPLIEASIRALGFDPRQIRVLLTTQAHFDHVGSLAHFKRLSGARVEVMDGDLAIVETGGQADYLFGAAGPRFRFDRVKVDRTLHDGDTVALGDVTLTARRTPGHTPGSTTWLTTVTDGARSYRVVFAGSTSINPGTRLVGTPSYPGIAEDFAHAFEVLESLTPDVFLAAHTGFFAMEEKRARLGRPGSENPFVDPEGYRAHVAEKKRTFDETLARQRAEGPASP
jgi:metallo-beta-lactamase class B